MSVNLLLLPLLEPKITCDTVSLDGHEVSNLLTQSVPRIGMERQGFIAATFIKPPVNITITFACNVDIDKIVVDGRVSLQRSTGMEVYTASVRHRNHARPMNFDDVTFQCVGRAYLSEDPEVRSVRWSAKSHVRIDEKSIFTFVNNRFRSRFTSDAVIDVEEADAKRVSGIVEGAAYSGRAGGAESTEGVYVMSHRLDNHLSAVSAVCLRITKTINSSAVAVRRIEVWGQLSGISATLKMRAVKPASCNSLTIPKLVPASCDSLTIPKLVPSSCDRLTIPRKLSHVRRERIHGIGCSTAGSSEVTAREGMKDSQADLKPVDMPLEFLDAITHEVMTCPLLLPCGQTVDKTTLDRYCKEEAVWGRAPSDPFTGKSFTSTNKPLVSDSLKARLDRFMLRHADKIWADSGNKSYVLGRRSDSGSRDSDRIHSTDGTTRLVRPHSACVESPRSPVNKKCKFDRDFLGLHSAGVTTSLIGSHSLALESPMSPVNKETKVIVELEEVASDIVSVSSNDISMLSDNDLESFDDVPSNRSTTKHLKSTLPSNRETETIDLSDDDDCVDLTYESAALEAVIAGTSSASHESALATSLNSALQSTLAALPSFTKCVDGPTTVTRPSVPACTRCDGKNAAVLYTLSCRHLICRSCLVASMKTGQLEAAPPAKCSLCDTVILTHLATKAHFG